MSACMLLCKLGAAGILPLFAFGWAKPGGGLLVLVCFALSIVAAGVWKPGVGVMVLILPALSLL